MATVSNPWGSFGNINVGGSSSASTTTGGSTITNVDRIDIGIGPRLNPAPTDTSGFKFVGQTAISEQDYLSRKVDFGSEFLDIGSLGQQTGISVSAPAVGEDVALADTSVYSKDDAPQDDVPDILKGTLVQGTGESREIVTGTAGIPATHSKYNTYSEYLTDKQLGDRVNIGTVQSLYEPLARGEMPSFSELGLEAKQAAQELPGEAKKGIESLTTKEGIEAAAKKGIAASFSMAGPMMGLVGGIIGGQTVTNAFGEASLRPAGILGAVADMVHSRQYQDMAEIRAAELAGGFGDKGFAIKFGNFGLTRKPGGGGYIGNMQGMSFNQVKELEALSKGYIPTTYSFDVTQKTGVFGQKLNQTVAESGGMFSDPSQPLKGYYTAEGKYYTPGVGLSRDGMQADMQRLANSNGLDYNTMKDIVGDARDGKGKLADLVAQHKANVAAEQAAAAAAETKRQQDAAKASQQSSGGGGGDSGGIYTSEGGSSGASPSSSGAGGGSFSSGAAAEATGGMGSQSFGSGWGGMAAGGTVGMAAGGAMAAGTSGFIGAPPSQVPEEKTVADDQNTQYPEGTFIINAAAVEEAGEADIVKMLNDAEKEAVRRGITIDKSANSAKLIDVAVSQGEVKVAPYLAKIIGYDRLRKINNRGKPETNERLQQAAQGGMLGLAQGGVAEDPLGLTVGDLFSSNTPEDPSEYEDRIIIDEVRRKMNALVKEYEGKGVNVLSIYDRNDPITRDVGGYTQESAENTAFQEDIPPNFVGPFFSADNAFGMGSFVNVPRTPNLGNLFIMAEEFAHQGATKRRADDEQAGMSTAESNYAEELRAKKIAFETVLGMLPKAQRGADVTVDAYSSMFLDYIYDTADILNRDRIIVDMMEKYPPLERQYKKTFGKNKVGLAELKAKVMQEEKNVREANARREYLRSKNKVKKASGGFI